MPLDIPEDRGRAHILKSIIGALKNDAELMNHIGGPEHVHKDKAPDQLNEPVAVIVQWTNATDTAIGPDLHRTFSVVQVKLVMTRPEVERRDQLYPEVVCGRINTVMRSAFPGATVYRGRDDAGGIVIENDDTADRIQWPQRFRALSFT